MKLLMVLSRPLNDEEIEQLLAFLAPTQDKRRRGFPHDQRKMSVMKFHGAKMLCGQTVRGLVQLFLWEELKISTRIEERVDRPRNQPPRKSRQEKMSRVRAAEKTNRKKKSQK